MGIFGKVTRGARSGEYIPASEFDTMRTRPTRLGNGLVELAIRFYREHPRLVHTLASAAFAIALARLAQRRRL